jgi:hypothetical protein
LLFIFLSLSVLDTWRTELQTLLSGHTIVFGGIQGRYFIPPAFLVPFATAVFRIRKHGQFVLWAVVVGVVSSNVIALFRLGGVY